VVKNVAGYDLGKLFTGSLGSHGVIVEANLKLFPMHPARATFAFKTGTLEVARDLRRNILRSPIDPMRLVLLDAPALELFRELAHTPAKPGIELWIEVGGSHRVIERCLLELRHLATAAGATLERRDDAEESWQKISNLAHWLQPKYHILAVLKAVLPIAAAEEFLRRAQQEASAAKIPLAGFAQVGVGIVHLCILQERPGDGVAEFVLCVRQAASNLGGTLIVEHCGAELKRTVNVWGAQSDDLGAMHRLKSVWDPNAILSPGRFVDGI
jgi:FAD/FMN-containing dehydrogenase